jgi:hypothetical protein
MQRVRVMAGQTIDRAAIRVQRDAQIVKSVHMSGLSRRIPPKALPNPEKPKDPVDLYEFY